MRVFLTVCLLVASQPLLIGAGVLTKWAIKCAGEACAGTVRAIAPFGSPRDALLTALAATAPYLLAALVATITWLLARCRTAHRAVELFAAAERRAYLLDRI
jgi:hypothetical protein